MKEEVIDSKLMSHTEFATQVSSILNAYELLRKHYLARQSDYLMNGDLGMASAIGKMAEKMEQGQEIFSVMPY